MYSFRSRALSPALLALVLTAGSAAAATINVSATAWGTRGSAGGSVTDQAYAGSWAMGYAGQQFVDAYWGFDLAGLGNITSVSLVAYLADVNYQDITEANQQYGFYFMAPDTSNGVGSDFTYADLGGAVDAQYTYASVYVKRTYQNSVLCQNVGDPGCEINPLYPLSAGNPTGYWGPDGIWPSSSLTFNPTHLEDLNAARTSEGGMFWLSAEMRTTPRSQAEALIFKGSAPGSWVGETPVDSGSTFYLQVTYEDAGGQDGGSVPEPASFGLMALGTIGIAALRRKRA